MTLETFFKENTRAAIAFSGGADSAYLLYAARKCGADVQPYYVQSAFQPAFEREDAERLCAQLGLSLRVLPLDILAVPCVRENGAERCYYCKQAIFGAIAKAAEEDGYTLLIDGTNASDDASDRPGMRALREMKVRSPLRECGVTKTELRRLSREAGLFTHDKPAYACLATRVQTAVPLTEELLQRVEKAESAVEALGFSDFRVRTDGAAARLELLAPQLPRALQMQEKLKEVLCGFTELSFAERQARD